jgi:starch phosphorylase
MKLALKGALTIVTYYGATLEILDRVGAEHLFMFGLTADQVEEKRRGRFTGREAAARSPRLADAIDCIREGMFSPGESNRFRVLAEALLGYDHFMVAADFDAYWDAQRAADALWNSPKWWRSSILNTARMGWFSSDRAVREYAHTIWRVEID